MVMRSICQTNFRRRSDLFGFLRRIDVAHLGFAHEFGLGQEAEAALAPGEVDADVEQRVGAPAGAGEIEDVMDTVGLARDERHGLARHMVRGRVDAQDQIAGADSIAHGRYF